MPAITPCLWFDTKLDDVLDYYFSIFPDSSVREQLRYGEEAGDNAGELMYVVFELAGNRLSAINGGGQEFPLSEAVSLEIDCADQAEIDYYWDKLTADGGEEGPCGWCKDKYGLSWQVAPSSLNELFGDPDPARAARAMNAMMQMKKLVIADLEAAANG